MPFLADRLARVKPSPTMAMTALATELKAAGRDIISLSVGEPDFDTPPNIQEAAIAAMRRGETRYTVFDGSIELKRAVCGKFKRENGLDYETSQITISSRRQAGAVQRAGRHDQSRATRSSSRRRSGCPTRRWCCCATAPRCRCLPAEQRLQDAARGSRRGDHAADQMADPELAVEPDAAPPTPRRICEGVAEVLLRHPHVWVMTDDMYEHLVYDDFEYHDDRPGRAASLRAHPDRQRRLEGLLHDRLADRLWRRPEAADQGDGRDPVELDRQPVLDQPGGGDRGADRAAGFHPGPQPQLQGAARPRRRYAEPGPGPVLPAARGCVLRLSVLRRGDRQADPGRPDDRERRGFRPLSARGRPGSRWCTAPPSGCRRISASPTRPRPRCCATPARASTAPAAR